MRDSAFRDAGGSRYLRVVRRYVDVVGHYLRVVRRFVEGDGDSRVSDGRDAGGVRSYTCGGGHDGR